MITKRIKYCRECSFHSSGKEFSTCSHPIVEKRGCYECIVNPHHNTKNEFPKWCPIKKGYIKINRDTNDNIISKVNYILINNKIICK